MCLALVGETMDKIPAPALRAARAARLAARVPVRASVERVRAAAANNNYLDHIDAPFLLTIEWKGFDENSIPMSTAQQQNLKRIIPIKITNMELDVNQGGTVYQVQAIQYNEFGFVNRYAYTRTAGTLPAGASIKDSFQTLEDLLNQIST